MSTMEKYNVSKEQDDRIAKRFDLLDLDNMRVKYKDFITSKGYMVNDRGCAFVDGRTFGRCMLIADIYIRLKNQFLEISPDAVLYDEYGLTPWKHDVFLEHFQNPITNQQQNNIARGHHMLKNWLAGFYITAHAITDRIVADFKVIANSLAATQALGELNNPRVWDYARLPYGAANLDSEIQCDIDFLYRYNKMVDKITELVDVPEMTYFNVFVRSDIKGNIEKYNRQAKALQNPDFATIDMKPNPMTPEDLAEGEERIRRALMFDLDWQNVGVLYLNMNIL